MTLKISSSVWDIYIYHPISMPSHQEGSWGRQFNLVTVNILENSLEKIFNKNSQRPYYHKKDSAAPLFSLKHVSARTGTGPATED